MRLEVLLEVLRRYHFARFLAAGGAAAMVNIVSRIILSEVMTFPTAVATAYLVGMVTAWILMRRFVFPANGGGMVAEFGRFAFVNLFAAAQVMLVSVSLADYVFPALSIGFHREALAHIIGVAAPTVSSYFGHKHLSFRAEA